MIRRIGFGLLAALWLPTLVLAGPRPTVDGWDRELRRGLQSTVQASAPVLASPYLPVRGAWAKPLSMELCDAGATEGSSSVPPVRPLQVAMHASGGVPWGQVAAWHCRLRLVGQPRAPDRIS